MYIDFPNIDPVAFHLGSIAIKWYGIAWSASLFLGWWYCDWVQRTYQYNQIPAHTFVKFIRWTTLAMLLGGRLGHVLFYQPTYYLQHPLKIFSLWEGGMSAHGGLAAVMIAIYVYTKKHKIPFFQLMDIVVAGFPIGLFLGRLANFVNDELYGRVSTVAWAVKFPRGGFLPRHPSQLYEAFAEGIILFIALYCLIRQPKIRQNSGTVSGAFLILYGIARFVIEFFREPEVDNWGWFTIGQILCVPMILGGIILLNRHKLCSR